MRLFDPQGRNPGLVNGPGDYSVLGMIPHRDGNVFLGVRNDNLAVVTGNLLLLNAIEDADYTRIQAEGNMANRNVQKFPRLGDHFTRKYIDFNPLIPGGYTAIGSVLLSQIEPRVEAVPLQSFLEVSVVTSAADTERKRLAERRRS